MYNNRMKSEYYYEVDYSRKPRVFTVHSDHSETEIAPERVEYDSANGGVRLDSVALKVDETIVIRWYTLPIEGSKQGVVDFQLKPPSP